MWQWRCHSRFSRAVSSQKSVRTQCLSAEEELHRESKRGCVAPPLVHAGHLREAMKTAVGVSEKAMKNYLKDVKEHHPDLLAAMREQERRQETKPEAAASMPSSFSPAPSTGASSSPNDRREKPEESPSDRQEQQEAKQANSSSDWGPDDGAWACPTMHRLLQWLDIINVENDVEDAMLCWAASMP